jgi:SAM-dependent methyltransferase
MPSWKLGKPSARSCCKAGPENAVSNASAQQRVKEQYERWPYPEPIVDLEAWLAHNWQWFDPSHAALQLWPEGPPGNNLEILIAGCGTNQAAIFAFNNPEAHVVGIDVNQTGLEHHQALKQRHGLDNLELRALPIEQVSELERSFDLIVSTGVLHHLDDPAAGLKALAGCLKQQGCIGLMLYARYGRIGVELVQQIAQDLELEANDEGVELLKACLQHTSPHHPLRGYLSVANDLDFDGGLIDTFLPKREHSFRVNDCLDLVAKAGLTFQNWLFNSPYYPQTKRSATDAFIARVSALPVERQWCVMERLNTLNACHFFMARGATRKIAPAGFPPMTDLLARVPMLRQPFAIKDQQLHRHQQRVVLREHNQRLLARIDGTCTVAEICDGLDQAATLNIVAELWRLDVIALAEQNRSHQ